MAVKDYNVDPDLNTTISGINIAEGCAPSGINNAIRQLMADVKEERDERDAAQTTRDAEQDAAITTAQKTANTAKTAATAAQRTADEAVEGLGNAVHKSGNEEVAGVKTFTDRMYLRNGNAYLNIENPGFIKGSTGANATLGNILFASGDVANTVSARGLGRVYCNYNDSEKVTKLNLLSYRNIAEHSGSSILSICMPISGTGWAEVNGQRVVCVASWKSGANWYRKYSDGWIEQGGRITSPSSDTTTSFNTAFASKVYNITFQHAVKGSSGAEWWNCSIAKSWTLTNFNAYLGGSADSYFWYACGY